MCHIDNFSTCDIDKTFMSILGIEKLSILGIDNESTYYIEKSKFST